MASANHPGDGTMHIYSLYLYYKHLKEETKNIIIIFYKEKKAHLSNTDHIL